MFKSARDREDAAESVTANNGSPADSKRQKRQKRQKDLIMNYVTKLYICWTIKLSGFEVSVKRDVQCLCTAGW